MVDFKKLSASQRGIDVINPAELFNRLPKPPTIDDLHQSQAEALTTWFANRDVRDTAIKLNTGGGKTLVGLLIALSSARELHRGALYLVDSKQLVRQVCAQAKALGIHAIEYDGRSSITSSFRNGDTILVAHYQALFNGHSAFGLISSNEPEDVSVIVIDDAHSSFDSVREAFTVEIEAEDAPELFRNITSIFRSDFASIDRESTFDEFASGTGSIGAEVLQVPFWSWLNHYRAIAQLISESEKSCKVTKSSATTQSLFFSWPLIKDNLKYCMAILSRGSFSITPIIPFVDMFPTFSHAPRRVYMSATFADESAIIRTFGCNKIKMNIISPKTLAGVGRRMILQIGDESAFRDALLKKMRDTAIRGLGVVVLEPNYHSASNWSQLGIRVIQPDEVEGTIQSLRNRDIREPVVFVNRYNGIDLPGDACRLLVVSGIPKAMSSYRKLLSNILANSRLYARSIAQCIEQAIGRGTRGSGDYCVVVLLGCDLCEWVKDERHAPYMTPSTRAQITSGEDIMNQIHTADEFSDAIDQGINDDPAFAEYLAGYVADKVSSYTDSGKDELEEFASKECKAIHAWREGSSGKCIKILNEYVSSNASDQPIKGLALQIAAQVAYCEGDYEHARQYQCRAHELNSALVKAAIPLLPSKASLQATRIVSVVANLEENNKNVVSEFDAKTGSLEDSQDYSAYEMGLEELGTFLGAESNRFDRNGEGPDVLWVFKEDKLGIILEAKNEKKKDKPLTKIEHGQLLVAGEWFKQRYPSYQCVDASVHPNNFANRNASVNSALAFTLADVRKLKKEVRLLLIELTSVSRDEESRLAQCDTFLDDHNLRSKQIVKSRMHQFVQERETQ